MRKRKTGKKRRTILFFQGGMALVFVLSNLMQVYAQRVERFPYEVSLRNGKPAEIVTYASQFTPIFTSKGVTLTNATTQFSGIAIDHLQFKSNNGLTIEFEYLMYGGERYENKYGDGISVFLYDGSKTFSIGARGAAMGYAYNRSFNTSGVKQGLDGAYLGIGIDNYGNFKNRMWTNDADRMAGLDSRSAINPSYSYSHVTMRGAMLKSGLSGYGNRGVRFSGYPVLFSTSTMGGQSVKINSSGNYEQMASSSNRSFAIRPSGESLVEGDSNYRKVIVKLVPGDTENMIITVQIQHGNTISTLVDQYNYPQYLMYYENANSANATSSQETGNRGPDQQVLLDTSVPPTFKIGFAASTGAASQVQIIRNLKVSLPFFPETEEELIKGCQSTRAYQLYPFENDRFYRGKIGQNSSPITGNDTRFINYNTFRFEDANGNAVTTEFRYTQTGVGEWTFDPLTGEVRFVPVYGYVGRATIYYSALGYGTDGGPFDQTIYRSGATKMEIDIEKCSPKTVRVNSFLVR